MSTAQVWVNGALAGLHENCGYTCFVISNQVSRTDSSVIAVKVDNSPQADVPPGAGWVDYVPFGGINRNTWLQITDQVYIPEWGQIISTPAEFSGALETTGGSGKEGVSVRCTTLILV
jgi:beta-galactosidase